MQRRRLAGFLRRPGADEVRALAAMGIDPEAGVLRLSFTHYTSEAEVSKLIQALDIVL